MLTRLQVRNFTTFSEADLTLSKGLNVFIGENGAGKSHLLKLAYSVLAASHQEGRKPSADEPSKSTMSKVLADKLSGVFRPDTLGRLVRRRQGRERCETVLTFSDPDLAIAFDFATNAKKEVNLTQVPAHFVTSAPVFLPTRELLSIYPNFVSMYDQHYLEFEETWRDTCLLLGAPLSKGPREAKVRTLLEPLEDAMGGAIEIDKSGRFYLKMPGSGNMEMPLVAEGLRKLGMVARLIATGALVEQGYLFWDEPEANLNPRLTKEVARVILQLCQDGIQVFVATHSLFLMREFDILLQRPEFAAGARFFGLQSTDEGYAVNQGDDIDSIGDIASLDEELNQSDRYMRVGAADANDN